MYDDPMLDREKDCPVCSARHDHELQEATLLIHEWFHGEVVRELIEKAMEEELVRVRPS
jgi:hypothetical protein